MSSFEVQSVAGEDHFCIEVPNDCSVGDVLKKASEHSGVKGASLWYSDIELNCGNLFADYFEPERIYQVRVEGDIPDGTLLKSSEAKLRPLGVKLDSPQLLMKMNELKWSIGEFLEKAGGFAPTLVLIKMKNGTECGGVAGVPWPKSGTAADPAKDSFVFSLGATPTRFDLVKPEQALYRTSSSLGFGYEPFACMFDESPGGCDLGVASGVGCGSDGQGAYAGPRENGQLIGRTGWGWFQPYEGWELWHL
jgi:hypothetical protein